jgi:hypothetical protein
VVLDLNEPVRVAGTGVDDVASLSAAVAADPGSESFPALAESLRRAGRLAEARRVAEAGLVSRPDDRDGRIALSLTLLDLGEPTAARDVLVGVLSFAFDPTPSPSTAGASASMLDVSVRQVDVAEPLFGEPDDLEIERAFDGAESDPDQMMDANRVAERVLDEEMRELALEQVTLHDAAESPVLDAASADAPAPEPMGQGDRIRILATLETWLQNIRRQVA